jgi:hypothetical protein
LLKTLMTEKENTAQHATRQRKARQGIMVQECRGSAPGEALGNKKKMEENDSGGVLPTNNFDTDNEWRCGEKPSDSGGSVCFTAVAWADCECKAGGRGSTLKKGGQIQTDAWTWRSSSVSDLCARRSGRSVLAVLSYYPTPYWGPREDVTACRRASNPA